MYYRLLITFLFTLPALACQTSSAPTQSIENQAAPTELRILPGALQMNEYLPLLKENNVGVVVNHTSTLGNTHLVDTLISAGVNIVKIFAPEHGFRGTASAGKKIEDGLDPKTELPIISLYGANRKPTAKHLSGIDLIVFDIQDVGVRFYTYISTLSLVMESCAEHGLPLIVLDRPNPNGHYIDGPVRKEVYKSFVGMHPIPVVYGMTIGEYAQMVNQEGWLASAVQSDLTVIRCQNYTHASMFDPPIKPSPNLPNLRSILLYPSLCFFEGTALSIGRGTELQFQVIGHPEIGQGDYVFTPTSRAGATSPKLENLSCRGESLTDLREEELFDQAAIDVSYLIKYYDLFPDQEAFFSKNLWIDKLAGTDSLRLAIIAGTSHQDIKSRWQEDLEAFKLIRSKYLLYPDF